MTVTTPEAIEEAKPLQLPSTVELTYALPVDAKKETTGKFWAFFPTQTRTWLTGIINAPWRLSNDRQNLLPGHWNTALMEAAGNLIGEVLPDIATKSDPGRPLDAFPRQPGTGDNIAEPLLEATWQTIQGQKMIPDAEGQIRYPRELRLHPYDDEDMR